MKTYSLKKEEVQRNWFVVDATDRVLGRVATKIADKIRGSMDYKYISKKFDWIFVSNFKKNNDDTIDIIRRFISFIDITYINRTKIKFFFNDIPIESIYSGSKINNLWVRCKSRLSEMRTQEYLTNN